MDENPYEPPKVPNEPSGRRMLGDVIAWTIIAILVALLVAMAWPTRFS